MQDLYTVAEASKLTGIAKPTLRAYTGRYSTYLSTEATPEQGAERSFTAADLKLLAFIYSYTSTGKTHDQVLSALSAGGLERFDWQPPESQPDSKQSAEAAGEALVPLSQVRAFQLLAQESEKREQAAQERIESLQAEVQRLERELGQAQGALSGFRSAQYKSPAWWRSLFGGRASE